MKILSVDKIKEADAYTILHEPIASIDLMERASLEVVEWIVKHLDSNFHFIVFCGPGNNGGDGLAIARLLNNINYSVDVVVVNIDSSESNDFKQNFNRLPNTILKYSIKNKTDFKNIQLSAKTVVIDALFGSGLNKPLADIYEEMVSYMNAVNAIKIAVDIPSGLFCDKLNDVKDVIFKADYVLSFQFPKYSFMLPENSAYVGLFSVLDIGLHNDYLQTVQTNYFFIDKDLIKSFVKSRNAFAHKGNFGHAFLMCGSYGKTGAAVLSAKACLNSGVGLLTVYSNKSAYETLQICLPEAMVEIDENSKVISDAPDLTRFHAIGVGCGIGIKEETQQALKKLIQSVNIPVVFDADAINILANNKTWLSFIPENSVFTPHIKEFERLVGVCNNSEERIKKQIEFSIKYKAILVLKGHHTSVSSPDGMIYFNSTGNPGMATAGSGDVLTGIITSLIAQGYNSLQASIIGVYLHGLAGDIAAINLSQESLIASDIIENISKAFQFLEIN